MGWSINLPTAVPAVSGVIDNTGGRVVRLSARETSGVNTAAFEVYDGTGVGGVLLDTIALNAGQSTRDSYDGWQYPYAGGLYLNVISGTFKASFTVRHSDDWSREGMPVILVNPEVLAITIGPDGGS